MDDFSVTRRRAGDAVVVAPVGEIDLLTADELRAEVRAAAAESQQIVLDLREVTFIDSAGLRLVLESSREVTGFAVVRGPSEVRRVFSLVGLEEHLTMLDRPPGE